MDTSLAKYQRLEDFCKKLWSDVYPEPISSLHSRISAQMFARFQQEFPLPAGSTVLDIGCGQGVALELFKAANLDATGIAIGNDVQICKDKGFKAIEMDLSFLEFPDASFDMVWCRHALEHSIFPFFSLSEMHRVLKPNGVLYVEVPAPDTACFHEGNKNHYSVLGKRMWMDLIRRSGFVDIRAMDLSFQTGAGPDVYFAFMQKKGA